MASGSSSSENNVNQTQTTTLPGASDAEKTLREKFNALNTQQIQALQRELERFSSTESPFKLSTQDQQELDTQFKAARDRFNVGIRDFADYSAGSRGMRMSDTPISQQTFERAGLGLGDIEAQRAQAQLALGLQANQFRRDSAMGLGTALPGTGAFNLQQYLQERAAQGTTRTVGTGFVNGTQTPSGLSIGAQLAGGIGGLAMGGAAAMGMMGAGAGTAGSLMGIGAGAVAI